jgi:hypothetical protein
LLAQYALKPLAPTLLDIEDMATILPPLSLFFLSESCFTGSIKEKKLTDNIFCKSLSFSIIGIDLKLVESDVKA